MKKALIFDMDGTLFDTEILTMEGLRAVSRKYGENDDVDKFYPTTCGTTLPTAKLLYEEFYGNDYPFYERREEVREWMKEFIDTNGIPLKRGAKEILDFLRKEGFKIALATSATRKSAESHLKKAHFEGYFDATVCGDEVKNSKPNPEIFLKAAEKLGVNPLECYVAEDSYLGVEAGFNAGMTVFMIPDMNPPREKEKTLAYKICESLLEVIDELKK